MRRFVIPVNFLALPDFRVLMDRAAEEYGFEQEGGLRLPCDEEYFQDIMVCCYGKLRMNYINNWMAQR
ncbi:hypothetical protein GIB67_000450 [Kingdonia uniflora]|uniref:Uncharacterized protein n=1 Tax=Kingdonia uniflora TaxID=39325 RepID=A0A7J7KY44_9MAGN|nr:hypothetical protein GIB67_000450 [Kingdonia uniflora]